MSARKAPRRAPGSRLVAPAPRPPARRPGLRRWLGVLAACAVLGAVAVTMTARSGGGPAGGEDPACGWDLTVPEGVAANQAYLEKAADWLSDQPAGYATPPPPDSPYWHGECPVDPDLPTGPPIHESDP